MNIRWNSVLSGVKPLHIWVFFAVISSFVSQSYSDKPSPDTAVLPSHDDIGLSSLAQLEVIDGSGYHSQASRQRHRNRERVAQSRSQLNKEGETTRNRRDDLNAVENDDDVEDIPYHMWGEDQVLWGKKSADLEKRWNRNNMRMWGKRNNGEESSDGEAVKKWNKNGVQLWGKRGESGHEEKKWSKNGMQMWGKRKESGDIEKKWSKNGMQMWGKREKDGEPEKKWSKNGMQMWGKRGEDVELEKKWSKNGMQMWGKRGEDGEHEKKWSKNGMQMWGKRSEDGELEKKWSKNGMQMWGKRSEDGELEKKWSKNGMQMWGKRSENGELQKKWSKNGMQMWGKRGENGELEKKWSKNGMQMWGKREDGELEKKWSKNGMQMWGKRGLVELEKYLNNSNFKVVNKSDSLAAQNDFEKKWNRNGMQMWGKRDGVEDEGDMKKKWNKNGVQLWGKSDENSDEYKEEEKKWNKNMRMWGKREDQKLEKQEGKNDKTAEKLGNEVKSHQKRWDNNGMRMWGKRPADLLADDVELEKKWNRNGMRMWGKRSADIDYEIDYSELARLIPGTSTGRDILSEEKRWDKNGMRMWGKRSDPTEFKDSLDKRWDDMKYRMWGKREGLFPELLEERDQIDIEALDELRNSLVDPPTKKWTRNKYRIWGKRDVSKALTMLHEQQRQREHSSANASAHWLSHDSYNQQRLRHNKTARHQYKTAIKNAKSKLHAAKDFTDEHISSIQNNPLPHSSEHNSEVSKNDRTSLTVNSKQSDIPANQAISVESSSPAGNTENSQNKQIVLNNVNDHSRISKSKQVENKDSSVDKSDQSPFSQYLHIQSAPSDSQHSSVTSSTPSHFSSHESRFRRSTGEDLQKGSRHLVKRFAGLGNYRYSGAGNKRKQWVTDVIRVWGKRGR